MRDSRKFVEMAASILNQGHTLRFQAEGWSMQPTIRYGETILVEPLFRPPGNASHGQLSLVSTGIASICRGDIVLYRWAHGGHIGVRAHRVVRIVAQAAAGDGAVPVLILRGDAGGDEERVPAENVLGRVVSLDREGRRIQMRGAAAFARRAFAGSAARIRRSVARHWRLTAAAVGR